MKAGIHPKYETAIVVCACGNTFETRSTRPNMRIDLCNVCHPFYTGEQRIVDTAGQVERFLKKVEGAAATDSRPSKRQLRINQKTSKLEDDRRRAEEAARAAAAERAAIRRAAMDAEAQAVAALAEAEGTAEVAEVEAVEA